MHTMPRLLAVPLAAALVITLFTGCARPRAGDPHGRIEPGQTTRDEVRHRSPILSGYIEFADVLAQDLAQEITQIRAEQGIEGRVTVAFGDIANKTGIVPTDEFEIIRNRLRTHVTQSPFMRQSTRWVDDRRLADALIQRELNGAGAPRADVIDIDNSLALNMDMLRADRGGTQLYAFYVRLSHFRTREVVFEREYLAKQVRP